MKKNFSQKFDNNSEKMFVSLIIRDLITRKYLIFTSNERSPNESDFKTTLKIAINLDTDIALQLTKQLFEQNIVITSYREIARNNNIAFSFIDDTPGQLHTELCYYVEADIPNIDKLTAAIDNYSPSFVTFEELVDGLKRSPVSDYVSILGLSKLIGEYDLIG